MVARYPEHITLLVEGLPVEVTRKRIRNLNLRIRPEDGGVCVSAPRQLSDEKIASFVREKANWIARNRLKALESPMARAEAATEEELAAWRTVVQAGTEVLMAKWQPVMGVHAETVVYRSMKSRWGSCRPDTGRICINTRLALFPPRCLEYVVVHELCHLLEGGHGPRFQALMTRYLPDWKETRALLRS